MKTRTIGSLEVSVVGLGCNNFGWRIDADATAAVVDAALDSGINFFDTADFYGKGLSEKFLGKALGSRRDKVVLATKFGLQMDEERHGAKPAYIRRALEDSLSRLGTDRIDLYQLHKPDPETPIADTLGALDELVKAGKIRQIGCSNFTLEQLHEAESAGFGFAPRSGAPRDRDADPQDRQHRTPGDQLGDDAAVRSPFEHGDRHVVGEQLRPALDVAGQGEDELRRRGHVDGDVGLHASAPGHTRPIASRATDTMRRSRSSSRANHAQRSVEPSTSSVSSPPVTWTRYRTPRKCRSAPFA